MFTSRRVKCFLPPRWTLHLVLLCSREGRCFYLDDSYVAVMGVFVLGVNCLFNRRAVTRIDTPWYWNNKRVHKKWIRQTAGVTGSAISTKTGSSVVLLTFPLSVSLSCCLTPSPCRVPLSLAPLPTDLPKDGGAVSLSSWTASSLLVPNWHRVLTFTLLALSDMVSFPVY